MRISILILGISLCATIITTVALEEVKGQIADVKKWKGEYPEMNGDYPLTFIAFKKGGLIPTPYVFIRTWPTHYYVTIPSLPVSDGAGYADRTKIGALRIAAKLIEKRQMKKRYQAKKVIRDDTQKRKTISQTIFDARSDKLPDVYRLTEGFVMLYKHINMLDKLNNSGAIRKILKKEADDLLMRFVMANLLDSDHGDKLDAFAEIHRQVTQLSGEVDYTYRKIQSYQVYARPGGSYAFLAH